MRLSLLALSVLLAAGAASAQDAKPPCGPGSLLPKERATPYTQEAAVRSGPVSVSDELNKKIGGPTRIRIAADEPAPGCRLENPDAIRPDRL